MDDLEFSEEEIRKELENLGYFNVNNTRLSDFKRGTINSCGLRGGWSSRYWSIFDNLCIYIFNH